MIAVFGEIVMLLVGLMLIFSLVSAGLFGIAISTRGPGEGIACIAMGVCGGSALIWAAIHFGPIVISVGAP